MTDSQEETERDSQAETEPDSIPLSELRSELDETQTESTSPDDDTPLSGLRDTVRQQQDTETDVSGAFIEEDVEPIDSAGVWADLLMDAGAGEGQFGAESSEDSTLVISKRICERCEYLADPPALRCTHEGTTIHELVDVGHVRVSACPMVGPDGETKRGEE
ncbi:hypothetical protein RH831_00870 [Halodesulfurarchaeum sp. HSR-GB]|uniref:hypothetical protein n=1 Tax=Halodesulfurarchaeum sp. HSR-GB TaxID=3074077 RepID=UPI002865B236|nr:hypothetical protein [Halodesulfurarchaeum sp. HSR-GB]MDR5655733.1 hypothetical protein [Halodesulfurarchaeum sp. HSR-GB]